MADLHPRDELGRALPHPGWPADRAAPGELELVRRFCNSVNRENGAERFTTPAAFDAWLATEGHAAVGPSPAELDRIIDVREAVHDLVVANAHHDDGHDAWTRFAALLTTARLGFEHRPDGLRVAPVACDTDAFVARVGMLVAAALADGTWPRLKACHHCHWVVYDPSKNRSSRWCSMRACGSRHNAKEYRRRQRSAT